MNDFDLDAALVSKWENAYVSAAYSYIGFKNPDGFHLICGKVVFNTALSATAKEEFSFETQNIIAGRFKKAAQANSFSVAVRDAKAGKITGIDDKLLTLIAGGQRLSEFLMPKVYPPLISSFRVTGLSKFNLSNKLNLPRDLEPQLKSADVPFDSMDDLLNHCGLPNLTQIGDSTFLEIAATSPGIIDSTSTISKNEAIMEYRVSKALDVGRLTLGYRIFNEDQSIVRLSINGSALTWHEENNILIGRNRKKLDKVSLLQAYLSYDRIPLDQKSLVDPKKHPNPHHAAHQAFDSDFEIIKEILLKPEKNKADIFESAVSVLLTLLGFSSVNYGRIPKLQDGADTIAVTPSGRVITVECTIGLLNQKDKLAKLVQRTTIIRRNMVEAGFASLEVLPAIVTSLLRDEVAADISFAKDHGIAVVCRENIEDLLNKAVLPPNTDEIFNEIKNLVPPTERFLGLGF